MRDWTLKDWISMSLAVMAFAFSSLTTYVNVIRRLDEAKATFHQIPAVDIIQDDFLVGHYPVSFAIINSGSRSIAAFDVIIGINQDIRSDDENACDGKLVWFQTTFSPLALKPGEISLQAIQLKKYDGDTVVKAGPNGGWLVPLSTRNLERAGVMYGVCAAFGTASPARAHKITHADIGHLAMARGGSLQQLTGPQTPITLISERTTLFAQ